MGIYIYNENIKKKYKYFIKKNFFHIFFMRFYIIIVYIRYIVFIIWENKNKKK